VLIIPAIDLKGGRCVRLRQGRADAETVYSDDPVDTAKRWQSEGARWLHVVDLDGAFEGRPAHLDAVRRIAGAVAAPIELGGGIRTDEDVARVLDAGVARAIIGTRAFSDPEGLGALVERFGERIAVGIDARDGFVQVKGWVETTRTRALDLARRADALGVATLIYTDTATDGMLAGHNADATDALCRAVRCGVIASGGVSTAEDIAKLAALGHANLRGAIVGKALYDGVVSMDALRAAAGGRE
jgi:phosphoribosylformimino-5-aminoimidazole carboxamide ribotide isomerase